MGAWHPGSGVTRSSWGHALVDWMVKSIVGSGAPVALLDSRVAVHTSGPSHLGLLTALGLEGGTGVAVVIS